MKVVLKLGRMEINEEIKSFFLKNIYPMLNFGIAFEETNRIITVFEKQEEGMEYIDPTVEVVVELTERALDMALDISVSEKLLEDASGQFYDEARAIRFLKRSQLDFSIEFYSCRYKARV